MTKKSGKWHKSSFFVIDFLFSDRLLELLQAGEEPDDWKPFPSIGAGVKEIRIHKDNEYRIIYVTKFEECIYILHAFVKKQQKTRKSDINLAKQRYKDI